MNRAVPDPVDTTFDVAELFLGNDDGLLWLSLGFASMGEPLDVLHIVCGKAATGVPEEDALYLERTDQDLACTGQVLALEVGDHALALRLTPEGASALELHADTGFTFGTQPGLFAQAAAQLARMAAAGHGCIVLPPASNAGTGRRPQP